MDKPTIYEGKLGQWRHDPERMLRYRAQLALLEAEAETAPIFKRRSHRSHPMLGTILIIILVLALIGALPNWGYHQAGYGISGGVGLVLVIVLVLVLLGRL